MFDELDPRDRHDKRPDEEQPEFEKLEFLPVEDESPAEATSTTSDLTFDLPDAADEPPVTVDPLAAATTAALEPPTEDLEFGAGTPFELLGSSLFDRFTSDDSLDWAFDFEDEDGEDLG